MKLNKLFGLLFIIPSTFVQGQISELYCDPFSASQSIQISVSKQETSLGSIMVNLRLENISSDTLILTYSKNLLYILTPDSIYRSQGVTHSEEYFKILPDSTKFFNEYFSTNRRNSWYNISGDYFLYWKVALKTNTSSNFQCKISDPILLWRKP